ncbi:acyl-CoA synthetase [Zhaonella formicivorans]|uniref:acyl-CoA synthetase n=1 Tax=Zhaonella formicivorans TaxID=2528593 RepID=UPI001D128BF5|nr:acyl-CoA synthetase [Zhaonella formicivorans]
MFNFPGNYIGPKEYLPDKIFALPELNYPEKINLAVELLDNHVQKNPSKNAILFEDQKITYLDLQNKVNRFANALIKLGVKENDRVMLRAPNTPEYIIANFACWRIGAIPVLCNHLVKGEEISYRANNSEALVVLSRKDVVEDVDAVKNELETVKHFVVFGGSHEGHLSMEELMAGESDVCESAATTKFNIGRLIYSSGTTGKPKGIVCNYSDILAVCDTHGKYVLKLTENDIVGGHPFFTFAFGSVNFTFEPWRVGCTLSIIDRFKPDKMFEIIEKHKITVCACVPTAFRMMIDYYEKSDVKYDVSSLRLCQSAGEWLPASTMRDCKKVLGVEILDSLGSGDLMYWLSTREGVPENKIGSTGISVPGVENKVVDENFNEVPRGTEGELVVRGPFGQVYWKKPEAQMKGVWNGWSRPGLTFVQDEDGYFWYKGRTDDMIVTSGYKIPGGEVEAVLNEHPAVLESAVVASPDPIRQNIVKAFVVLKEGYEPSEELIVELQEYTKKHLAEYKYPREIEFAKADELPRTSTGKIQRNVLRKQEEMKKKKNVG